MKQLAVFGLVCLLASVGSTGAFANTLQHHSPLQMDPVDRCATLYLIALEGNSSRQQLLEKSDSPIGQLLWEYIVSGGSDNSPKAIHTIPDINGDDIADVIVCSEDYYIRCLDGTDGSLLWQHEIYAGTVYLQDGLGVIEDVNGDGFSDVVVGATGGARLIQCISGLTGGTLWTHDTHEYGDGGWVYEVDCRCDYNGDGISDVLAATGDDSSGQGPQRIYCLNGLTGVSLWERPLGGPGFAVKSIADCTGDGQADVLVGCSNDAESTGYAKVLNGATGAVVWSFTVPGSSVWAIQQLDDISGDGVPDVILGDFSSNGNVYGLNAVSGAQLYHTSIGSLLILRLEQVGDVNNDGLTDIIPSHTNAEAMVLDGSNGEQLWSTPVADQSWQVAVCTDISGDGINDVLVGTLYMTNYVYFMDGVSGSVLFSTPSGEAADALTAIPDVTGDRSMEMVAGGREGTVRCLSGGLNASTSPRKVLADFTADVREGRLPLLVHFLDASTAQNTTITSWKWDLTGDGQVDSVEQNPVWTYGQAGVYTVTLTVSDGVRSDTETKQGFVHVLPALDALEIGVVSGGWGVVSVEVRNHASVVVPDVVWNVSMTYGLLLKRSFGGTMSLAANGSEVVQVRPVVGWGLVVVKVSARATSVVPVEKSLQARVHIIFVKIL